MKELGILGGIQFIKILKVTLVKPDADELGHEIMRYYTPYSLVVEHKPSIT